ncbi:MAG: glutathione S-transferase family protein [Parvularculaceae bacterium]|nr:glutathione S-transferase family protein [Parvularculaceae bacterium]
MTITGFTLHHFPASRSARVLWALYETTEAPVDIETVDLYGGALFRPAFRALNPNHAVPTLEIRRADGSRQVMIESGAIVAFLGDAYPEKHLAPPPGDSAARADYMQMLFFTAAHVDMSLWQIRVHEHLLPEAEKDEATIARYRAKMREEIEPQLLARLASGGYACGDDFTLADCLLAHAVTWARGYGLAQDDGFRAYLSRCSKRPAFLKAFADARAFKLAPADDSAVKAHFSG